MTDASVELAVRLIVEAREARNLDAEITACCYLHDALEAQVRRELTEAQKRRDEARH